MTTRLDYVEWDEYSEMTQKEAKELYQRIEGFIDNTFHASREKSLALTKLEESWMWVEKAIKVDQEARNKPCMGEDGPICIGQAEGLK